MPNLNYDNGLVIEKQIEKIKFDFFRFKFQNPQFLSDLIYKVTQNSLVHRIELNVLIGIEMFDFVYSYSPTNDFPQNVDVNFVKFDESPLTGIYLIHTGIKQAIENKLNQLYMEVV